MHATTEVLPLADIEARCAAYDKVCIQMEDIIDDLEQSLQAVKASYLRRLKNQAATVAAHEAELRAALERAPQLFQSPRTMVIHGVKVGFIASKGKLTWDIDDSQLIVRIKNEFGTRAAFNYLHVKETPDKEALRAIPEKWKDLGCYLDGIGDAIVLSRVDGEVSVLMDRLVKKMVAAMTDEPPPMSNKRTDCHSEV